MDAPMVRGYRGVAKDNLHFSDALLGRVTPIGGPASPLEHCLGDTASKYTSWTTSYAIAVEKALDSALGGRGVILTKDFSEAEIIASPDIYDKAEILIIGTATDASVKWIP